MAQKEKHTRAVAEDITRIRDFLSLKLFERSIETKTQTLPYIFEILSPLPLCPYFTLHVDGLQSEITIFFVSLVEPVRDLDNNFLIHVCRV